MPSARGGFWPWPSWHAKGQWWRRSKTSGWLIPNGSGENSRSGVVMIYEIYNPKDGPWIENLSSWLLLIVFKALQGLCQRLTRVLDMGSLETLCLLAPEYFCCSHQACCQLMMGVLQVGEGRQYKGMKCHSRSCFSSLKIQMPVSWHLLLNKFRAAQFLPGYRDSCGFLSSRHS
jgi:hypothetical protein